MQVGTGKSILNGIAIGKLKLYKKKNTVISTADAADPAAEEARFEAARAKAIDQQTALYEKALDEAEPADEEYTELRDALAKAQAAYDNISGQLNGYQQQLDAGKQQMYAQGLISSPSLSNTELVTEAKAALRKMKLQLLQR